MMTATSSRQGGSSGEASGFNAPRCHALLIAIAGVIGAHSAAAQTTEAAQTTSETQDLEQVVVTGSRIDRSGFTTPTPVTAITTDELKAKAYPTVVDLVNDIPQLRPNTVSIGSQNVSSAYLDLRGIGPSRTLLLVDGRRFAETSPTGGTDINVLPSALISSVDVVTGGASAAYGSDAVAGVVEINLDDKFQGLKGNVQGGVSQYGDAANVSGSLGFGTHFDDDRGHFVLAVDGYTQGGTNQGPRSWGQQAFGLIPNVGYAPGNGQPQQLIVPNVRQSEVTYGGVIIAPAGSPLHGIQFGPGGAPEPFNYGTDVGTTFMIGGDGADLSRQAVTSASVNRQSVFSRIGYDVTSHIEAWGDVLFSRSEQAQNVIPNYNNGNLTISIENAFLPSSIRSLMSANNIQSFLLGRENIELGFNFADGTNTTLRYGAGLKGKLDSGWSWDTYVQYSSNEYYSTEANNRKEANWTNAVDSVINPANGQPICRSTLTNPNNGCVPVDVFGPNSIAPAALGYIEGTSWYDETETQADAAANLRGDLFSLWAGPVSIATGLEFRREATSGTSDPLSLVSGWRQVNAQPLAGAYDVGEVYLESDIPLAKDLSWAQNLDFDGATRLTDYSTSGLVNTWKLGINYSPVNDVRFRATRSHDIRAPNVNELFQTRGQNISPIFDPVTNQSNPTLVLTGGNAALQPEIGDTITGGIVYEPHWATGLKTSIDYYTIDVTGAITTLDPQTQVTDCYAGQTALCSGITRNAAGSITEVFSAEFNAQEVKTNGFDFEAAYGFPAANGRMSFRLLATYVDHLITTVGGVSTDTAGQPNDAGVPHWRGNITATYTGPAFTFMAEGRYIEGGLFNSTYIQGLSINNNQIPNVFYVDLSGSYAINDKFNIYLKIDNLFNTNPPIIPNSLNVPHASTSPFYDLIGRQYALGVRFNLL